MGNVDRIQPVTPPLLHTQPASGVQTRKEGRQQPPDQQHDKLELHEEEIEATVEEAEIIELPIEHSRLDLTA